MIKTVGRYELLEVIGRGGAAVVYLADQRDLHRRVALKELASSQAATDASFGARFAEESRLTGSLSHPNIVTVYEYFEHDGVPYIAMEYMSQGSLRPYVSVLTLPQIVGVLEGVLAGLALGQSHSIVHRDLKPENLLVTADGRVKIADFGVARAYSDAVTREVVTAAGTTIGTPAYMAPEQALGGEVGPATDLYSLGIVAWELLTDRVPFADTETPVAVLYRQVHEPVPLVRSVAPDVDPRVEAWLARMLAKDPADRFPSAEAAWEELEHVVVALLGPLWRRDARLPVIEEDAAGLPLTPAVFTDGPRQADSDGARALKTAPPRPVGVADATLDDVPAGADRPRRPILRALGIVAFLGAIAVAVVIVVLASGAGAGTKRPASASGKTSSSEKSSTKTSSSKTSSTKTSTTKTSTTSAAVEKNAELLTGWLVKRGDDPPYVPATPSANTNPETAMGGAALSENAKQMAASVAALKGAGFRITDSEGLNGPASDPDNYAGSEVLEFGSSAGALRIFQREALSSFPASAKRFTVPGVASAKGIITTVNTHPAPTRTAVVDFPEGSCIVSMDNTVTRGDPIPSLKHAAKAVYQRTHGDCP